MGGDNAPAAPVGAAIEVAAQGLKVLLVGDRDRLAAELTRQGASPDERIELVHAPERVHGDEDGARAVRAKPDASIVVACKLVGEGRASAAVSAGNTGAMLAAATLRMRRIPGIMRPAIAVVLPAAGGKPVVLLDAGASADMRPEHYPQLAMMGRLFARDVLGIPEPQVGLLSIGEEEGKGSLAVQNAFELLRDSPGFVGNVEGRDIPTATVDVVVTDGFTGNVVLKTAEGVAQMLLNEIRRAVVQTVAGRVGGMLVRPSLRRMRDRIDPELYGGAVLLGVRGGAVIGHGNATPVGIANAVRVGARAARENLVGHFAAALNEAAGESPAA